MNKRTLLSLVVSSMLLASAPVLVSAQAAKAATAPAAQGSASKIVLDSL